MWVPIHTTRALHTAPCSLEDFDVNSAREDGLCFMATTDERLARLAGGKLPRDNFLKTLQSHPCLISPSQFSPECELISRRSE